MIRFSIEEIRLSAICGEVENIGWVDVDGEDCVVGFMVRDMSAGMSLEVIQGKL